MFLGVTKISWVLLGILYFPLVALVLFFWGRAMGGSRALRAAKLAPVGLGLLALPVADAALSHWRLQGMCPEAGLRVYERVAVEGYFDETSYKRILTQAEAPNIPQILGATGYRFWEYIDSSGRQYERVELTSDDRVIHRKIERPTARYHYKKRVDYPLGNRIERSEQRIVDTETGKDIAVEVLIGRYPGLVDGLWMGFFGPFQMLETCHVKGSPDLTGAFKKILVPIDKQPRQ